MILKNEDGAFVEVKSLSDLSKCPVNAEPDDCMVEAGNMKMLGRFSFAGFSDDGTIDVAGITLDGE